ncbi:MAG: hypothetical protein KAI66_00310 [Lentisphaeria bacterium]|nr:hypothetical protein [Lentisphaeria bacterium]
MAANYYLTLFPMEAIIASQHEPHEFGTYMATGAHHGLSERTIFVQIKPGFDGVDWDFAEENCVPHSDGRLKNSVYLRIYRALEIVPLDAMGSLFLTTRDGRSIELEKRDCRPPEAEAEYYVYQELCPVMPLVVSRLKPRDFGTYITEKSTRLHLPKIAFADLKVLDLDNFTNTGNVGALYDRNTRYLRRCIDSVTDPKNDKMTKTLERSHVENFSFNIINAGVCICDANNAIMYPMPARDEIRDKHYDWGRSALIL